MGGWKLHRAGDVNGGGGSAIVSWGVFVGRAGGGSPAPQLVTRDAAQAPSSFAVVDGRVSEKLIDRIRPSVPRTSWSRPGWSRIGSRRRPGTYRLARTLG